MMEILHMSGVAFAGSGKIFNHLVFLGLMLLWTAPCLAADSFITLCYHDIPLKATVLEDVPKHIFVNHLEYLRTHGYTVISPDDIRAARKGFKTLPDRAVLLTFDDAYLSFYRFVLPLLKLYNYPAVLSVVTSWIGNNPNYFNKEMMSWEQIREAAKSELVYLASHTHKLHKAGFYNPIGNVEPATSTFIYSVKGVCTQSNIGGYRAHKYKQGKDSQQVQACHSVGGGGNHGKTFVKP